MSFATPPTAGGAIVAIQSCSSCVQIMGRSASRNGVSSSMSMPSPVTSAAPVTTTAQQLLVCEMLPLMPGGPPGRRAILGGHQRARVEAKPRKRPAGADAGRAELRPARLDGTRDVPQFVGEKLVVAQLRRRDRDDEARIEHRFQDRRIER